MSRIIYFHFWWFILIVLFIPKVNVIPVLGLPSVKPEDFYGLIILALVVVNAKILKSFIYSPAIFLIFTAGLYCFLFPASVFVLIRWIIAFSIILYCTKDIQYERSFESLLKFAIVFLSFLAILQKFAPVPFVHTGEIYIGPAGRPSGLGSNAVEFGLIIYFSSLSFVVLTRRKWLAIMIVLLGLLAVAVAETRVVFVAQAALLIVLILRQSKLIGVPISLGLFVYVILQVAASDQRVFSIDVLTLVNEFSALIELFRSEKLTAEVANYCFSFNDDLASDQSFAMRLSKALFVINHVVLGPHWQGFGFGNCIGGAADSQFIRMLNDFGIVGGIAGLGFFIWSIFLIVFRYRNIIGIGMVFGFMLCFAFYDIVYFSRSLPLVGLFIHFLRLKNKNG